MTTAHRPTFDPARGKEDLRGAGYHQRLLPAHTSLKQRKRGQGGIGGLSTTTTTNNDTTTTGKVQTKDSGPGGRDLRAELLEAEAAVKARRRGSGSGYGTRDGDAATGGGLKRKGSANGGDGAELDDEDPEKKRRRLILEAALDVDASSESEADSDDENGDGGNKTRHKDKNKKGSDEDSDAESSSSSSEDDDDDDDDDSSEDEDEEAGLARELAKVRAERAAKANHEKRALEKAAQEQKEKDIALGNPLLNEGMGSDDDEDGIGGSSSGATSFGHTKDWSKTGIFRNQAKGHMGGEQGRGGDGGFVNDLLRSDFHRKFMSRYVR